MIIPVMHKRVRFHLDQVKSPRLNPNLTIDQALNIAEDQKKLEAIRHFQLTQEIREELKPMVKNRVPLTPVGSLFTYPSDYDFEVSFAQIIDGKTIKSFPMIYNEQNDVFDNAFAEPSAVQPYHIESSSGVTAYYGTGTLTGGLLSYIVKSKQLYYSQTRITAGPNVLTVGTEYYVETSSVMSNSISYLPGDTFVAAITAFTGTGSVAAIQNSQLGDICSEQLCIIASQIISGTLEDYARYQIKSAEAK